MKLRIHWGCSGKQPHRGWKGRSGTSAHGRPYPPQSTPPAALHCGRTSFSPRENPFSLPTILLFAPKQPPMLWENRDRYHFPNYGIAADAEPCTHAREQAGNNPKTGKMVPVPIFPPRKVYSPSGLFTSSFRIPSPTKRFGNRENNIRQTRHWHMVPISPSPFLSLFARDAPAEQAT